MSKPHTDLSYVFKGISPVVRTHRVFTITVSTAISTKKAAGQMRHVKSAPAPAGGAGQPGPRRKFCPPNQDP